MKDLSADLVVIGAGIVGLASALEAVTRYPGLSVIVVEKERAIARHQTGNNSGVIHSGIYYRPGSLKAANCVKGAAAMIAFCRDHGLAYEVCGKVVVATHDGEVAGLHELLRRGTENGVPGVSIIGRDRLKELEPHCEGVAALHVPGAGITDYGAVAQKYAELFQARGGRLVTDCEISGVDVRGSEIVLASRDRAIRARHVVNCAGLHSDRVMRMAGDALDVQIIPFRGEYYKLAPARTGLVRGLIYPVPDPQFPFLGVHFTRHIKGFVEAGPNAVLALKREGYGKADFSLRDAMETVTFPGFWKLARKHWSYGLGEMYRSISKAAFANALRKLLPEISDDDLEPAGAGIRAQALDSQGKLVDDFSIVRSARMIHVCNVPSPAATASLTIGAQIVDMAAAWFDMPRGKEPLLSLVRSAE